MKSSYKPLGNYIKEVNIRNSTEKVDLLLGVSIKKVFMPSIANIIGTDMSTYKIIKRNQFAYGPVTSRNGEKISIALLEDYNETIVSQAYTPFEIIDTSVLLPEYLMMWFRRPEFDRYARFKSHGSAREIFGWDEMCEILLPIPHPDKQKEIVNEYNIIQNRIALNNQLIQKLEETAQAIYKQWFVEFEFPDENGKPYKSNGGEMVWFEELDKEIPVGWEAGKLGDLAIIIMGQSPTSDTYNNVGDGMIFYQGRTEFGYRFPAIKNYTTQPKRKAKKGDILMSVRAPVGDLNIALNDCCIGRGVASLKSKIKCNSFLFYSILNLKQQFEVSNGEGTIFGSITKDGLYDIQIIKPIDNIVILSEIILKKIDKSIENYSKQNAVLLEAKDLLLSKLATVEN